MKWILLSVVILTNPIFSQDRREDRRVEEDPVSTVFTVNTSAIRTGDDYVIDVKATTTSYAPGGIETISISDLDESNDIILTIPGGEEGTPIKIVFNIVEDEIVNFRGRVIHERRSYDTYFDNEEFIQISGTTITIYNTDQRTLPIENKIFLALEGGLVFSPNGDDSYDELSLIMEEDFNVTNIKISELDGRTIYETDDKNFEWNGIVSETPLGEGVYNYTILIDEETIKGQFLVQY